MILLEDLVTPQSGSQVSMAMVVKTPTSYTNLLH